MKVFVLTTFASLGFAEPILRALRDEGYETPTPIQAKAIPLLKEGHDLLGIAQTGTGKTAAFALPILDAVSTRMQGRPNPGTAKVLVLAPTRELVAQIADSFKAYGRHLRLSVTSVVGGVGYTPQTRALRAGVDILVATPGRLIDHLENGNIRLNETAFVVLDEADHMFDLGFIVPIRKILAKLPKQRQSLFFSATMPKEIAKLAGEFLTKPKEVAVAPVATTAERVDQQVYLVDAAAKRGLLVELLQDQSVERCIVFTRTKRGADRVSSTLESAGIPSDAIHGNKSQNQRQRALDAFKAGQTRVLVATDIAARGIDVDNVTHVINFELPEVPEQYVHRIGRTARAGAEGKAISFCDISERGLLKDIERTTRQQIPSTDKRGQKGADVVSQQDLRSNEHRDPRAQREGGRGKPRQGGRPPRERKPFEDRAPRQDGPRFVADTQPVRQRSEGDFSHAPARPARAQDGERRDDRRDGRRGPPRGEQGRGGFGRGENGRGEGGRGDFNRGERPRHEGRGDFRQERPQRDDRNSNRTQRDDRPQRDERPRSEFKPRGDFQPRGEQGRGRGEGQRGEQGRGDFNRNGRPGGQPRKRFGGGGRPPRRAES